MHMAIGSMIAAALTGLAASTAVTLAGSQSGQSRFVPAAAAPADALQDFQVRLADGEAYIDQVHYDEAGSPVAFTMRVGAGSRFAARFRPALPVRIDAEDVLFDARRGVVVVPFGEHDLLAQQAAASIALADADSVVPAGTAVITDRGHRFGEIVEDAADTPEAGQVLMIRLYGAGGGLQRVPAACAGLVPETGLVVVRACNLDTV
ncbi:hypothetical protein [Glycocaulis sp.]|uniref:hypothetical protein n=1 Tax=Glycocaulis sp. TaxID=1969725 RepID=UPI003D26159F